MTDLEQRAIRALRAVKMPEKNWHGKRAELLNARLQLQISERLPMNDAADLWFLVWTYRRQIADREVVNRANEIVNGAMSLVFT